MANLSPALALESGLDPFKAGVAIMRIRRGSIVSRLDFRPGDVVKRVNAEAVKDVTSLEQAIAKKTSTWNILIERKGRPLEFSFRG